MKPNIEIFSHHECTFKIDFYQKSKVKQYNKTTYSSNAIEFIRKINRHLGKHKKKSLTRQEFENRGQNRLQEKVQSSYDCVVIIK